MQIWIQWGSEIWISNGQKRLQMFWISNWIWNLEAQPFEIRIKMSEFWMVWLSNGWDYSFSHSLSPTIWNSTFKKCRFQMFPEFEWSDFRSPLYLTNFDGYSRQDLAKPILYPRASLISPRQVVQGTGYFPKV